MYFGVRTCAVCVGMVPHCCPDEPLTAQDSVLRQVKMMTTPRSQIPTTAAAMAAQKVQAGFCDNTMCECSSDNSSVQL